MVEFVSGKPHRPHAHGQRPRRRSGRLRLPAVLSSRRLRRLRASSMSTTPATRSKSLASSIWRRASIQLLKGEDATESSRRTAITATISRSSQSSSAKSHGDEWLKLGRSRAPQGDGRVRTAPIQPAEDEATIWRATASNTTSGSSNRACMHSGYVADSVQKLTDAGLYL